MKTPTIMLCPISPVDAKRLRAAGGSIHIADENPGYPCRQCMRDAEIGDELILVSYDPFTLDTPYRSASPIFLHRTPCEPDPGDELPRQLTRRLLSVRAFDDAEQMIEATVIQGQMLEATLDNLFTGDAVDSVHVHNAERGCWASSARRVPFGGSEDRMGVI